MIVIYWEQNLEMIHSVFWFVRLGEGAVCENVAWKWRKRRGEVEEGDGDRIRPVCKYFGKKDRVYLICFLVSLSWQQLRSEP